MKKTNVFCMILLCLGMMSVLVACGSNGSSDTDSSNESSSDEAVEIQFWTYDNADGRFDVMEEFVSQWNEENPNIQVKYDRFPLDQYMGTKFASSMVGGSGPDVFFLSRGDYLHYVESGLVEPLTPYFDEELKADFLPQVLEAVTYQGDIMTYPIEMDPVVLYYNKQIFEEANLAPPKTYDELKEVAVELNTEDRYGIYLAPTPNAYQNFIFSPFVWQGGADFTNEEMTQSEFNGEGAVEAIELWRYLAEHGATPTSGLEEPLANGLAAMEVAGPWKLSTYQRNFPDFYENEMGIAPLPIPEGGHQESVYGGWGLALNSRSEHKEEAAQFLMWMFSDPERAVKWNIGARASMSPQESIRNTEVHREFYEDEKHAIFLEVFETARAEAANPQEVNTIIQDAIGEAFTNQGTSEEIVKKADERINEYLQTR